MENKKHNKSMGLPGGPNEYITHISDFISTEGYKRNSPDVNNPYNIIPSGDITMEGVDFPVVGTDNLGNRQTMMPGMNYQFPGDSVYEVPLAQEGVDIKKRKLEYDNNNWKYDDSIDPSLLELSEYGSQQKQFIKEYIQSPKYLERLKKEFPDYSNTQLFKEVSARLSNVDAKINFLPESGVTSKSKRSIQGYYGHDHTGGTNFDKDIYLRPEFAKNYTTAPSYGYETIPLHEIGHAVDEGGKRIPQKTKDYLKDKLGGDERYYQKPTEFINRLTPYRFILKQEGIYNPGTEEFTQEMLNKSRNNPKIRFDSMFKDLENTIKSDEDFIEIMNNIALVPDTINNDIIIAQTGNGEYTIPNDINTLQSDNTRIETDQISGTKQGEKQENETLIDFLKKTSLNPYNWGVEDYSSEKNQDAAFSKARAAGLEEFIWNGNRIATNTIDDNRLSVESQGKEFWDRYKILLSEKYPDTKDKRYKDALDLHYRYGNPKINIGDHTKKTNSGTYGRANFSSVKNRMNIYGANQNPEGEVTTEGLLADYQQELLHSRQLEDKGLSGYRKHKREDYKRNNLDIHDHTRKEYDAVMYDDKESIEGVHKVQSSGIKKRYNRYYNYEENEGEHYEVFRADVLYGASKNFHPYEDQGSLRIIQKALAEKGYDMSGSLKKDGTYDGIYGDETKNALKNYNKLSLADKRMRPNKQTGGSIPIAQDGNGEYLKPKYSNKDITKTNDWYNGLTDSQQKMVFMDPNKYAKQHTILFPKKALNGENEQPRVKGDFLPETIVTTKGRTKSDATSMEEYAAQIQYENPIISKEDFLANRKENPIGREAISKINTEDWEQELTSVYNDEYLPEYYAELNKKVAKKFLEDNPQGDLSRVQYLNSLTEEQENMFKSLPSMQPGLGLDFARAVSSTNESNVGEAMHNIKNNKSYSDREIAEFQKKYESDFSGTSLDAASGIMTPFTYPGNIARATYNEQPFLDALAGGKPNEEPEFGESLLVDPWNLVGLGIFSKLKAAGKFSKLDDVYKSMKGVSKAEAIQTLTKTVNKVDNIIPSIKYNPSNNLIIKSIENGSPLEKQLNKAGEINVNNLKAYIGKEGVSKGDKFTLQKVLDEKFAGQKNINYNEFKNSISDELIPLNSKTVTGYDDYGVSRIGYGQVDIPKIKANINALEETIEGLKNYKKDLPLWKKEHGNFKVEMTDEEALINIQKKIDDKSFELQNYKKDLELGEGNKLLKNETITYSNKERFGQGDGDHFDENTLGHSRYLVSKEEPNIFHSLETQSDYYQNGIKDTKEQAIKSLKYMEEHAVKQQKLAERAKKLPDGSYEYPDGMIMDEKMHNAPSGQIALNDAKKIEIENWEQKQFLGGKHQERLLQENVDFASKNGQTIMRYPTSETAAKIQGYTKTKPSSNISDIKKANEEIIKLKKDFKELDNGFPKIEKVINMGLHHYNQVLHGGFSMEHATILKKYNNTPKMVKKTLGQETRIVTDSKGNTWHEFDIPKEPISIRAFQTGGGIPIAQTGNGEYKVKSGDTFYGIANRNEISNEELLKLNPGIDIDKLKLNQNINLTDVVPTKVPENRDETSWGDYLNPYNWNVSDRDDDGSFNQAFAASKEAGENEFMWYGKRYTTELSPELAPEVSVTPKVSNKTSGITNSILMRQAYKESLFDPNAESPAGYKGLTQIGKKVIEDFNKIYKDRVIDPFNTQDAVDVQKYSMNELYNSSFINKPNQTDQVRVAKTLAAYNWGRGNFKDYLTRQKDSGIDIYNTLDWTDNLPIETSDYINKILLGSNDKFEKKYKTAIENKDNKQYLKLYGFEEGGETDNKIIYKNYIDGVYDGTNMEEKGIKVYDKLNRMYYKNAKAMNMSPANYVLTHIVG